MSTAEAVRMEGVSKSFGGVKALQNVDLHVARGEIHALLGENGAGKSTILKILDGVYAPDAGLIEVDGVRLAEHTPDAARRAGISMIFQEMSLVPTLTVAQNIFLNSLVSKLTNLPGISPNAVTGNGATELRGLVSGHDLNTLLFDYNAAIVKVFYLVTATSAVTAFGSVFVEWRSLKARAAEQAKGTENFKQAQEKEVV